MIDIIKHNSRAFFYAFFVSLGLIFMMNIDIKRPNLYLISSIIVFIIVLLEISYIGFIFHKTPKQLDLPLMSVYARVKGVIDHVVLPLMLYVSLSGFIFFNNNTVSRAPIIILAFVSFLALFINLRAFYLNERKVEQTTYFVYDLIELIIYFLSINLILHIGEFFYLSIVIQVLLVAILTLGMLFINLYQFNRLSMKSLGSILLLSILSGACFYIVYILLGFGALITNSVQFLFYYLIFGSLRHKIEGTLDIKVILEYLSIFILSIGLLLGVST